jgi:hypothetical protein
LNFAAAGFLPIGGSGVYFVDPHLRTPYIYQYNLDVQRELFANTTLDIAYIGSNSHKLTGLLDANPFVLGTTKRLFDTQPGVASGTFSYLDTFANVANAHYNSLAVGLRKRMSDTKYLGSVTPTVNRSTTRRDSVRATPACRPIIGGNFEGLRIST